ncbi:MAG TPA: 30S ribosomal protein S12 methylthiotransferase RimO [Bacillota bacterium]|nr:30S ribosomal protein S12 methylthiotransferase RimO [Bacillota bacterium]
MKVYIDTLGCPKNTSDSEYAAGYLMESSHVLAEDPADADAIIVNTCGFINDAKKESIDRIFELSQMKPAGSILVVSGCLSQRYREELQKALPEVDIFIGVNEYHKLPRILKEHQKGKQQVFFDGCGKGFTEMTARTCLGVPYTAYLKISEGCDNVCTYCVIPSIRGHYRSRKIESIISEARILAKKGCKELILIAQDVTAYGIDLYGNYLLPKLLRQLCDIDGIRWIRLMYCYEDRITDELMKVIAENKKICKYIDIPIQHVSDKILTAMNRRSTRITIENTIRKLRQAMPDIHIRTTLITGFPGESEEDTKLLESFIEDMKFERLGVFAYSREEGTIASSMKNQIPEKTKLVRMDRLMRIQQQVSLEHNRQKIGQCFEVLVEGREEDRYTGRTSFDAPDIDNKVFFTSCIPLSPGDFVMVKIDDGFDYDLTGHAIIEEN